LDCAAVTSQEIVTFAKQLLDGGRQPSTVGNYISHLSAIFAIARPAWGYALDEKQMADAQKVLTKMGIIGKSNQRNGTAFASRHKLAHERVEAMKAIWTKSKAEYHGEFVNFDPMMTWPKPVQKPHPPILVGGAFPYGARRALTYGNGWMPHRTRKQYADVQALLPKFREMATEAGRDPASVPITIWGAQENLDLLKRDRDDGVSRVVVSLDSAKADTILPELDRWATLIRQLG